VIALEDRRDAFHAQAVVALGRERGPALLPAGILAETDHVLRRRAASPAATDALLAFLQDGSLLLDCGDVDPPRIRELMVRFGDLQLGFADAAVIACAERNGGRVMSFDRRDFLVVAGETAIDLVP
jgi:predicted nucleic acid-binding protein